jgi:hypothetical protein
MTSFRYSPLASEPAVHGPWETGAETAVTTEEGMGGWGPLIEHAPPRCTATEHAMHADHQSLFLAATFVRAKTITTTRYPRLSVSIQDCRWMCSLWEKACL